MIKKFKEFIEEGFMKTVSQIANGDTVRDEDNPKNVIYVIEEFMLNHEIEDYTINKDLTVDVNDNIKIGREDVVNGQLPFKFGKVSGNFNCSRNQLTSLKGAPKEVVGDFNCAGNQLTSLDCCPQKVGGDFNCNDNQLTSLKEAPKEVGGGFKCSDNKLTSLDGCPTEVCGDFDCSFNKLTSLDGCPTEVGGIFDCSVNQLTSLEGCPTEVGFNFYCDRNEKQFTEEDVKSLCDVKEKIEC